MSTLRGKAASGPTPDRRRKRSPQRPPAGPVVYLAALLVTGLLYWLGVLHPLDWWGSGAWR